MATKSATFYVAPKTRDLIGRLADDFRQTLGVVIFAALAHYRELLDADTPERPGSGRIVSGDQRTTRITVSDSDGIGEWVGGLADEWQTTRGQILTTALGYYVPAIESGDIPRPKPKPEPKPRKVQPKPVRAVGAPTLVDRAECGVCHKQVGVDPVTSLLVPHIAHPSVRPKGVFMNCDGSGQAPAGPVIHTADVAIQARRYV